MKDDLRRYIAEANGERPRRIYVAGPMRGYDSYNYPLESFFTFFKINSFPFTNPFSIRVLMTIYSFK